jgi:hypothetical protein
MANAKEVKARMVVLSVLMKRNQVMTKRLAGLSRSVERKRG